MKFYKTIIKSYLDKTLNTSKGVVRSGGVVSMHLGRDTKIN